MTRRTSAVIAEAVRRSPLAEYRERFAALATASGGALTIRERPFLAQVNFRADPNDTDLMERVASSLGGLALPLVPNTVTSSGDRRALWLGPDEWLIVGPANQQGAITEDLRARLDDAFGSIVDASANRTVLEIHGVKARDLLAHDVPIDLDARSFAPGQCAQTLLGKAQIIIERRDESVFLLYVRTSFASHVGERLLDDHHRPQG
jgi:sarcosine oxidase, subunit gamma